MATPRSKYGSGFYSLSISTSQFEYHNKEYPLKNFERFSRCGFVNIFS